MHTDPAVTVTPDQSWVWMTVVDPGSRTVLPGYNTVSTPYLPGWYARGTTYPPSSLSSMPGGTTPTIFPL